MVVFPNAKINLGLNIVLKRPDGYHNISSCFVPIGWKDALEAVPADAFEFTSSGLDIPGDQQANLCVKAYHLLKENHDIPAVRMHLHKVIPMGAGMGGGSADGAFALKLLNELFELNLSTETLERYAQELGADCPFFIQNTPKLVSGIGEVLEDAMIDLSNKKVVVVYPNLHVHTGTAFSQITPREPGLSVASIIKTPMERWREVLVNDFEAPVFEQFPEIAQIKTKLYEQGAVYASMTGSGSAVYGLFESGFETKTKELAFENSSVWSG